MAAQDESRFADRGYAALVSAMERAAIAGDAGARAFLASLREASPVALHRSATSLQRMRSPSLREQLLALPMPKALVVGDRSPPLEFPLPDCKLRGYVVPEAGHDLMANNSEGFAAAVASAMELR